MRNSIKKIVALALISTIGVSSCLQAKIKSLENVSRGTIEAASAQIAEYKKTVKNNNKDTGLIMKIVNFTYEAVNAFSKYSLKGPFATYVEAVVYKFKSDKIKDDLYHLLIEIGEAFKNEMRFNIKNKSDLDELNQLFAEFIWRMKPAIFPFRNADNAKVEKLKSYQKLVTDMIAKKFWSS